MQKSRQRQLQGGVGIQDLRRPREPEAQVQRRRRTDQASGRANGDEGMRPDHLQGHGLPVRRKLGRGLTKPDSRVDPNSASSWFLVLATMASSHNARPDRKGLLLAME